MQSNIIVKLFLVAGILISTNSFAASTNDACSSVSKGEAMKKKIEKAFCESDQVNLERPDPEAEEGEPGWLPYFFVNPDECNLSIDFPDLLPDLGFDLSALNSCQLIKAVSANALSQVDEAFNEIESEVQGAYEDGGVDGDVDIDIGGVVDDGIGDGG